MSDQEREEPTPSSRQRREEQQASTGGGDAAPPQEADVERAPLTQQIGRAVVIALVALFVVFVLANTHRVPFSWVFGSTGVVDDPVAGARGGIPLIVLLLASFAIGAAAGALGAWQKGRSRRRRRAEKDELGRR